MVCMAQVCGGRLVKTWAIVLAVPKNDHAVPRVHCFVNLLLNALLGWFSICLSYYDSSAW